MNWFHYLRMKKGVSQTNLAPMLGISKALVNQMERGWFTRPPKNCEAKLKEFFGEEWSFARLMEPVPDLTELPSAASGTATK